MFAVLGVGVDAPPAAFTFLCLLLVLLLLLLLRCYCYTREKQIGGRGFLGCAGRMGREAGRAKRARGRVSIDMRRQRKFLAKKALRGILLALV